MTALIQSSSGVTVITVGLVSAGLLPLRQAIVLLWGKYWVPLPLYHWF